MSLSKKLQVKDPQKFFIVNGAEELQEILVNEGFNVLLNVGDYQSGGILIFVKNSEELSSMVETFVSDEDSDCHWVAYPKKGSKISTDLTRDHGWEKLLSRYWLAVRQVSLNDRWSALRFRPRGKIKEVKRGSDYPGIDSQKKTVKIPDVLGKRLAEKGLLETFNKLSFTKRKESVISILDAKKPETLKRRIDKILESLATSD